MDETNRSGLVVGIPAFNEEKTIAQVITQARSFVDEVIVCDDGSDDLTSRKACDAGAKVIRHQRNIGYGAALSTIFMQAATKEFAALVIMDADGQHDANDIPRLIEPIRGGAAEIVIGSRLVERPRCSIGGCRGAGIKVFTKIINAVTGLELTDVQSGFRSYSCRAVRSVLPYETGMGASLEILLRAVHGGLPITEIPITIRHRDGLRNYQYSSFDHALDLTFALARTMVHQSRVQSLL